MEDTEATRGRILVIDDEESMRHALGRSLKREGFVVVEAANGRDAVDLFTAGEVDAVLTDMRLPDIDGLDLVAIFTQMAAEVPVLVMTGYGSMETALEAMRRGAKDFVQKPFVVEDVIRLLERALKERQMSRENRRLRALVERRFAASGFERVEEELAALGHEEPVPGGRSDADGGADNGEPLPLREAHRRFEIKYVEDLLAQTGGNIAAAARLAGISRPNFHKKLRTLDIDAGRFKKAARRGRTSDL
jgi:DNA-binding NtrC family response regulator